MEKKAKQSRENERQTKKKQNRGEEVHGEGSLLQEVETKTKATLIKKKI